jgi:hypothetical protein
LNTGLNFLNKFKKKFNDHECYFLRVLVLDKRDFECFKYCVFLSPNICLKSILINDGVLTFF